MQRVFFILNCDHEVNSLVGALRIRSGIRRNERLQVFLKGFDKMFHGLGASAESFADHFSILQ